MTPPTAVNPAPSVLSNADWQRLASPVQDYARAGFELLDIAAGHLGNGDLRQASEMGWGAAAQVVKAVAENWNVPHDSHWSLVELVNKLHDARPGSELKDGFEMAQNLHRNFYENDASARLVTLGVFRMAYFVDEMLPWLRRQRPV